MVLKGGRIQNHNLFGAKRLVRREAQMENF